MSEWEYYYLDEEDEKHYNGGLFQITRTDIDEDNPFDETVSFGKINLDFKEGEIAGIEIYEDAEAVISPVWREGSIDNPETVEVIEGKEPVSLIEKLKEKGIF